MLQREQWLSFGFLMKRVFLLFFFFSLAIAKIFAQETSVAGIVFDADSKDRIARVNVLNTTTGFSVYNNINGVFTIDAKPGDKLIFSQTEHHADTIRVLSYTPLAIYMKRSAIQLKEVTIFDSLMNPQKKLANTKRDFSKIYGSLAYKDLLSVGPSGAGLSIDALWNSFSRSGRNATHLRETIENDYKQDVIDFRFNKTLVTRITGLTGKPLSDFMLRYRPGYYLVAYASEYEFISTIKTNYRRYLRNPRPYYQVPLYPPKSNASVVPGKSE